MAAAARAQRLRQAVLSELQARVQVLSADVRGMPALTGVCMLYHTLHASIRWAAASALADGVQQQPGTPGCVTSLAAHVKKLQVAVASGLMVDVLAAAAPVQPPLSIASQQALGACSYTAWQGAASPHPEQQAPGAAAATPRSVACAVKNVPASPTRQGQQQPVTTIRSPTRTGTHACRWQPQPWQPQAPRSQLLWGTSCFSLFPPLHPRTWAALSQQHAAITAATWEEEQAEQQAARMLHRHPAFVPGFGARSSARWVDHRVRVQSG